jgi:hypothetical protein
LPFLHVFGSCCRLTLSLSLVLPRSRIYGYFLNASHYIYIPEGFCLLRYTHTFLAGCATTTVAVGTGLCYV